MANPLRIGVIGSGFGQHVHLPAFRAHPLCRVTAICASTLKKARAVAAQNHIPKAYGDWKALIQDPEIDAVSMAVPPRLQPAIVRAALKQGKPVFCEKPLALYARESAVLKQEAQRRRLPAMVNFEFLDNDVWKKAKGLLDAKKLGVLRHAVVTWQLEARAFQFQTKSWKTQSKEGGGVLSGFMSHTFYYLEHLLGPIERLSARLYDTAHRSHSETVDTLVLIHLEFANHLPASVSISNHAFQGSGHRVEIYGDKGSLKLINEGSDYMKGFTLHWGDRQSRAPIAFKSTQARTPADGRIATTAELVHRFVLWVKAGKAARPNFSDGHRVQTLMEWARQSHRRQKWIRTPLTS